VFGAVMPAKSGQPGQFKKGHDPRRCGGRPKGTPNRFSISDLAAAIKKVERKKHRSFMEVWIESGWGNPVAMDNIMHYMLPKLRSIEGVVATTEFGMSDELAEAIRNKLGKRYGVRKGERKRSKRHSDKNKRDKQAG